MNEYTIKRPDGTKFTARLSTEDMRLYQGRNGWAVTKVTAKPAAAKTDDGK